MNEWSWWCAPIQQYNNSRYNYKYVARNEERAPEITVANSARFDELENIYHGMLLVIYVALPTISLHSYVTRPVGSGLWSTGMYTHHVLLLNYVVRTTYVRTRYLVARNVFFVVWGEIVWALVDGRLTGIFLLPVRDILQQLLLYGTSNCLEFYAR